MTMGQDNEISCVERHSSNHPFYIKPALSLGNYMEAGAVSTFHAKTPRHTHLGAAIEGTVNMHRPQHIGQDIFRRKCVSFCIECPLVDAIARPSESICMSILLLKDRLFPCVNDWLRSLAVQTLYGPQ